MTTTNSTRVLRATPVPITLANEALDGPEDKGLVFDANVLVEIEDAFDGVDGWARLMGESDAQTDVQAVMVAVDDQPDGVKAAVEELCTEVVKLRMRETGQPVRVYRTVRHTLAIALGMTEADVGRRMLPGAIGEYAAAIGAAFAIANGVDPTTALAMAAERSGKLSRELGALVDGANEAETPTPGTRGESGPPPGSAQTGSSTSSGG